MITKHKAEALACRLEDEIEADVVGPAGDEYARITGPSWKIIGDSATLLRTIPAMEAEIEALKAKTLTGAVGSLSDAEIVKDILLYFENRRFDLPDFLIEEIKNKYGVKDHG